jgi:glyoxylase I family protein
VIRIENLHHVAVTVTDIARAKQFYGEVLGLRELPRPDFDFEGAWYAAGGRQIHLICHESTKTLRGTQAIDARDGHLALRVADYDETLAHLRAMGVEVLAQWHNKTLWAQLYVTDPDGNVIELNVARPAGATRGSSPTTPSDPGSP